MKRRSAAEMLRPTILVSEMQENMFVWYRLQHMSPHLDFNGFENESSEA